MRRFDRGPCPSWQPSGARRGAQMRLCVREKNHACLARRPLLSGGSGAHRGPALLRVVWPALRFSNPPRPGSNPPGVASSFGVDGSLCLRIGLANTDECGQVDLQRRVLAVLRNQTSRWRTTSRAEASRSTSASGAPPPPQESNYLTPHNLPFGLHFALRNVTWEPGSCDSAPCVAAGAGRALCT